MTIRSIHLASLGAIVVVLSTAAFAIPLEANLPEKSAQAGSPPSRSDSSARDRAQEARKEEGKEGLVFVSYEQSNEGVGLNAGVTNRHLQGLDRTLLEGQPLRSSRDSEVVVRPAQRMGYRESLFVKHAVSSEEQLADDHPPTVPKRRIVLIPTVLDHPWATHMYRAGCELLAACLNRHPDVEAVVSPDDGWPRDPAILEGVDAIVFYSCPAADLLLAPENRDAAQQLMKDGVGLVAIHWATGTTKDQFGPAYLDLLGGWFSFAHSGLKVDKQPLTQVDPKHPVCRGWEPYDLRDEFYLNLKFHPAAKPIVQVNVDGVNQTVAWAFDRPAGGRSFGTTLGHFHDNFAIEAFRQAIVNGVLWSAGAEVPENGADVDLPNAALQLPQAPAAVGEPAALRQPQPRPAAQHPARLDAMRQFKATSPSAVDRLPLNTPSAIGALKRLPSQSRWSWSSIDPLPRQVGSVVQLTDDSRG
jgi:hypothetical protein